MLASISAGYNSLFGNKESCENIENSDNSNSSDTGFSQPSCTSKSPMSTPELSRGIRSVEAPSVWSFTEASCSVIQGVTAEGVFLDNTAKQQSISPAQSANTSRSMPNQLDNLDMITLDTRCRSADFTLTAIEDMAERPESLVTLGDASTSSFPLDSQQRNVSTSDPSYRRAYVTALVKRRREIEEDLAKLNVKLLESFREEWVLTGVIPEGFAEIQSEVLAFDPKLKTTSFPFTHLLPNSRSETNFKTLIIVDKSPPSERDSGIHNSVDESSTAFNFKDSLTSSFSSMMADSFYFSQSDDVSLRTYSFTGNPARESLVKRLEEVKNDFAVVSQIYLIHRQRAVETNQSAFRKACKCNVQKLKEIQQEKQALEAKLREIDAGDQLSRIECSGLSRSTSVSVKEDYHIPTAASSTVATLPRRKTLRIPSLSHSGTLRLGKLRKRPSVKQMELENASQTPVIGPSKPVKSGALRHVPSSMRGLRFQLLPARLRMPRSQTIVQNAHLDIVSNSEVREVPIHCPSALRPHSMYATVCSSRACNSMDDLNKAQLQKHFSASGSNIRDRKGIEQSDNLGDNISDFELTSMFEDMNISPKDVTPKDISSSPTGSDEQSTSGAFSMTSQEFSLSSEKEVCLRRPIKVTPEESPIRCICSCISDHGDGNCDCCEESLEESKGSEEKSDSGVGQSREDLCTPTPVRSKFPVIMPSRQSRRSLNPFNLLRVHSGRRGPLWKR